MMVLEGEMVVPEPDEWLDIVPWVFDTCDSS